MVFVGVVAVFEGVAGPVVEADGLAVLPVGSTLALELVGVSLGRPGLVEDSAAGGGVDGSKSLISRPCSNSYGYSPPLSTVLLRLGGNGFGRGSSSAGASSPPAPGRPGRSPVTGGSWRLSKWLRLCMAERWWIWFCMMRAKVCNLRDGKCRFSGV